MFVRAASRDLRRARCSTIRMVVRAVSVRPRSFDTGQFTYSNIR